MTVGASVALSVALLVLNGFFVAAEFAIVSAKRHRLEVLAAEGSGAARAAVRNSRELSLMLAGAQLGITLATLGLGALAKPTVAELMTPLLVAARLPESAAAVVAVVIAVAVVVFLHMVVGEMAPKSWAISHPERSAVLLALPFRAFTRVTGPVLRALNGLANAVLRLGKVDPVDETTPVQGPVELQLLLTASREHGLIEAGQERLLSNVIDLAAIPIYAVTLPLADVVTAPLSSTAGDIERISQRSGRSRLVVLDDDGLPLGLVHVRDAVLAEVDRPVSDLVYEALHLDQHDTLLDAVARMRVARAQLAFVTGPDDTVLGVTALEDLLERVLGEFDDETDQRLRA